MDLIKEPNPAFNKQLFLQRLHKTDNPVHFKVLKLGNIFKSKQNGKPNFFVEMEILSNFELYWKNQLQTLLQVCTSSKISGVVGVGIYPAPSWFFWIRNRNRHNNIKGFEIMKI